MYITNSACISPQRTFDDTFFEAPVRVQTGIRYSAIEPDYGSLIPASLLRRMGKAVRMGVGTGLPLIQQGGVDGILLATATGGLEDCLKFLNQIVDYNEGTLTPTNFVQSTPNAVAGNLALMSKTTGYNNTHVHHGLAFEAALLDALMLMEENKADTLLLGSIEEISDYNHNIDALAGKFKTGEFTSESLLTVDTPGSVNGEGAAMFILKKDKQSEADVRIRDVDQTSYLPESQLENKIEAFLSKNNLQKEDIDALILGYSGDSRTEHLFARVDPAFKNANVYQYKNLVGDYPTSSAFAVWLAVQMKAGKTLPSACIRAAKHDRRPANILIYNHFKGLQHGLILLGD